MLLVYSMDWTIPVGSLRRSGEVGKTNEVRLPSIPQILNKMACQESRLQENSLQRKRGGFSKIYSPITQILKNPILQGLGAHTTGSQGTGGGGG